MQIYLHSLLFIVIISTHYTILLLLSNLEQELTLELEIVSKPDTIFENILDFYIISKFYDYFQLSRLLVFFYFYFCLWHLVM